MHTRGHTQWFYFSVSNVRKGVPYKFNIINLMKPDSLFNFGMKPVVYSEKNAEKGIGWVRGGHDICYYQNSIKRKGDTEGPSSSFYYTLTFSYTFERLYFFMHLFL